MIGSKIIRKDITGSTNVDIAELANTLPHGAVVTAEAQTAGRGRRGRHWQSPSGENLYFSLLLKPDFVPDKAPMLTLVMALAVAQGIEDVYGAADQAQHEVQIKWPNDIIIHGRKVCGILTEMQVEAGKIKHVIIGVGVNVHQRDFVGEGLEYASSLDIEFGQQKGTTTDLREQLLWNILERFTICYEQFCESESLAPLEEAYQARLINLGKEVRVLEPGSSFTGVALGIDEEGQLLVQKPDGSRVSIYAGEVSVRGLYGYV